MTIEAQAPAKIHCKACNHALAFYADGVYRHKGPAASRCSCNCEGQPLAAQPSWKPLDGAKKRDVEPDPGAQAPVADPAQVAEMPASGEPVSMPAQDPPISQPASNPPVWAPVEFAVSNSEIQTYKRCRRKWFISYYMRMVPISEPRHGPLALGTAVHAALAEYVTHQQHPGRVLDALYSEILAQVDPQDEEQLKAIRADRELGIIMLDGYVEWAEAEGVDAGLRLVSAEAEVSYPDFAGTGVNLMAKLDVEVEREIDGAHLFRDWKTCADFNGAKLLPLDEQMLTYMLLRKLSAPEGATVSSGLYSMLRKVKRTERAKPPFYMQVEAYHSETELRNFYVQLTGTIRELVEARNRLADGKPHQWVAPPTVDRSCTWQCPWLMPCQMMNDGSDWEGVLNVIAQPGDPYARYQRKTTEDI